MMILWIFLRFCYYGCLCFGGGSALTPIYIRDLVEGEQWMTLHEFANLTAVAQMTPGPIGINAATFFGFKQAGVWGALAATLGLIFCPYFLMTWAVQSLQKWENSRAVRGIMAGIKPATVGMILATQLIFMELSVFTGPIPWGMLWGAGDANGFAVRPGAAAIFLVSGFLLVKTKVSIMTVIFISAAVGAFLCKA